MVELEIQALSERRDGLLIDVGRAVTASGFTLQRQRLTQDVNGVLLTMVVRGPARKQRALEAALEAHERVISFEVSPFVEGESKPHFAAARTFASPTVAPAPAPTPAPEPATVKTTTPAPAPAPAPAAVPVAAPVAPPAPESIAIPEVAAKPEPVEEPEPEFIFITTRPSPAPAPVVIEPFVELIPLDPDVEAIEKMLPKLTNSYPDIFPPLLTMENSVAEGARESSLSLAGRRIGAWVFERDYATSTKLDLHEAIERVGIPALRALIEVQNHGGQLHIRNSPLCAEGGRSSCVFFSGYLEALLGPVLASNTLSIFPVCCRSYGADECVLALSD